MSVIVTIRRIFPPDFFTSARNNNNFISPSENLAKAVIVVTQGIDESDIRKGKPENFEPDFVMNTKGFEITFASNRISNKVNSISRMRDKYQVAEMEADVIKSISESIYEKSENKANNNYKNVDSTSVVVITLEPLLNWYGYLHGFNYPFTLRRRNEFFISLNENYISNSVFENLYILQLTEFKSFVLYDLSAFQNNPSEFITEISSHKLEKLPYCEIVEAQITDISIIDGYPLITYKFKNGFLKLVRPQRTKIEKPLIDGEADK